MLNEQQMRFAVVHKAHRFGIEPQQVFQLWAHEHAPQHSRGQVIAGKGRLRECISFTCGDLALNRRKCFSFMYLIVF
jgi:hypothetical protein